MAEAEYVIPKDHYWALDEGTKVIRYLARKRSEFFDFLVQSGLQEKIRRSFDYFHGNFMRCLPAAGGDMAIRQNPETGNVHLAMNEFRPLVSQLAILTTENPPAWDTMARNSSHRALQQAILGNDILDYEMDGPHHVEERLRDSVEECLIFLMAYVWTRWEDYQGRELGAVLGESIEHEGDVKHSNPNLYEVLYPWEMPWREKEWVAVYYQENVWNLIARHPEKKEELLKARSFREEHGPDKFQRIGARPPSSDSIEVGCMYHLKTPALPYGRKLQFAGDVVLHDTLKKPPESVWYGDDDQGAATGGLATAYGEEGEPARAPQVWSDLNQPEPEGWDLVLPVHRIIPARYLLSSLGYSIAFDLQGFQEALNGEISTVLNNHKNFAQLRIWTGLNSQFNSEPLDEGCVLITSLTKPEALELMKPIPEAFQLIALLRAMGEAISGVNAVARGIPTDKATSGVALALIDQKAQQAASHLIAGYYQLLSDVGSATLEIYQKHSYSERAIAATSGNTRTAIKTFSPEKLDMIERVAVKAGNPLSRTLSGRFELAKFLAENDLVKNKEEILTVLQTGQYKPLLRAEMSELAIISEENELLSQGQAVRVSPLDNHVLHIREHHASLDSTELRESDGIGDFFVTHIEEHIARLRVPEIAEMQMVLGFQVPEFLLPKPQLELPGGEEGGGLELPPPGTNGTNGTGAGPMPPGLGKRPAALPPGLSVQNEPAGNPAERMPRLPPLPAAVTESLKSARMQTRMLKR